MRALPVLVAVLMLVAPVGAAVAPGGALDGGADRPAGTDADSAVDESGSAADDPASTDDDATTAGAVAVDGQDAGENRTRYRVLSIADDRRNRTGLERHGSDVGPTLDLAVDETTERMETAAMREHIQDAERRDERQRRIIAALSEVRQDEVTLHQRQRSAIQAHAEGELSDRELLYELAAVAIEAERLRERLLVLHRIADDTEDFGIGSEVTQLDFRLQTYDGPVRSYAVDVARGDASADRFYVESGGDAVVLAVLRDGRYVRETFRGDRWARDDSSFDSPADGLNVTAREYPDIADAGDAEATGTTTTRARIRFPDGELRTFNSAGSERVFKEHQVRDLEAFGHDETRRNTRDGLNVTVNHSYRGAPVEIVVRDVEEGEPIEGVTVTVTVEGESEPIGVTDENGVVWAISPSQHYDVNAIDGASVVFIEGIEPTDPPAVEDD